MTKQILWIYSEKVNSRFNGPYRPMQFFDKGTKPTRYNHMWSGWNLDPAKWVKVKKITRYVT